jgi:PIN domain nuclease of toxin-antitoxin system
MEAGLLHRFTKGRDISLGDRACLVTARHFGVPAVTGDRGWQHLDVGVEVELIR